MRNRRRKIFFVLFIFIEIFSAFFIFNYTAQSKDPVWTFSSSDTITCVDTSGTGDVLVVGTENGSIYYIKKGNSIPLWAYEGRNRIVSLKASRDGLYLAAIDSNDTLLFFSALPTRQEGEIVPLWRSDFNSSVRIGGIYSYESKVLSFSYVVATSRGNVYLYSGRRDDPIWEFHSQASEALAEISSNGDWVVAADSEGLVYLFDRRDNQLLWTVSANARVIDFSISLDNRYIVIGSNDENLGHVYLLNLRNGDIRWRYQLDEPLQKVSVSNDGERIAVKTEGDEVLVFFLDNSELERTRRFNSGDEPTSSLSPPFGSYLMNAESESNIHCTFLDRPAPLWNYQTDSKLTSMVASLGGEYVYIADQNHIHQFSNQYYNELIPGSRIGWAIVFFTSLGGIIITTTFTKGRSRNFKARRDYLPILVGGFVGVAEILLLSLKADTGILIGGVGCALGAWWCWRGRGKLTSIFTGCIVGIVSSMIAGIFIGFIYWFGGSLKNILFLTVLGAADGIKNGLFCGPIGAVIGALLHKKYPPS